MPPDPTAIARLRGHLEDWERAAENVALILAENRAKPLLPFQETHHLWQSKAAASAALPVVLPPYDPAPGSLTFLDHSDPDQPNEDYPA